MDLILHIETSTKICSVALSENGKLLDYNSYAESGFVHSEKLTIFIEQLLQKNNHFPKDLKAISIAGGPGSYTGLRIGVSTAKGLCYALDIPLIAIDSLLSLASWAKENEPDFSGNFCAMIDARRMEVFSAIFTNDLQVIKPISADVLEENSYGEITKQLPMLLAGDGVEKTKLLWHERKSIVYTTIQADARGQIATAYKCFQNKKFVDLAYYEPFYLKDFIAGKKKMS